MSHLVWACPALEHERLGLRRPVSLAEERLNLPTISPYPGPCVNEADEAASVRALAAQTLAALDRGPPFALATDGGASRGCVTWAVAVSGEHGPAVAGHVKLEDDLAGAGETWAVWRALGAWRAAVACREPKQERSLTIFVDNREALALLEDQRTYERWGLQQLIRRDRAWLQDGGWQVHGVWVPSHRKQRTLEVPHPWTKEAAQDLNERADRAASEWLSRVASVAPRAVHLAQVDEKLRWARDALMMMIRVWRRYDRHVGEQSDGAPWQPLQQRGRRALASAAMM